MRAMPTPSQASLNPNDYMSQGRGNGFQKRQFQDMNQHYIHHNAVLPELSKLEGSQRHRSSQRSLAAAGSPLRESEGLPIKPNQMSSENSYALQSKIEQSAAAGVITELRRSSPSAQRMMGEQEVPYRGPINDMGSQMGNNRTGNADIQKPAFTPIQKVKPKSREYNPLENQLEGSQPINYSSKAAVNQFDPSSANHREALRMQQEQAFMQEERNFN